MLRWSVRFKSDPSSSLASAAAETGRKAVSHCTLSAAGATGGGGAGGGGDNHGLGTGWTIGCCILAVFGTGWDCTGILGGPNAAKGFAVPSAGRSCTNGVGAEALFKLALAFETNKDAEREAACLFHSGDSC